MSLRDNALRWANVVSCKTELDELARLEARADVLGVAIAEEVELGPLTGQDLDDVIALVARVAAGTLEKRRGDA